MLFLFPTDLTLKFLGGQSTVGGWGWGEKLWWPKASFWKLSRVKRMSLWVGLALKSLLTLGEVKMSSSGGDGHRAPEPKWGKDSKSMGGWPNSRYQSRGEKEGIYMECQNLSRTPWVSTWEEGPNVGSCRRTSVQGLGWWRLESGYIQRIDHVN